MDEYDDDDRHRSRHHRNRHRNHDEDDNRPSADARPNAYVPTDEKSMGVPRPYGKFAPFKPTDVTGQLRHYRKPTVADVDAP